MSMRKDYVLASGLSRLWGAVECAVLSSVCQVEVPNRDRFDGQGDIPRMCVMQYQESVICPGNPEVTSQATHTLATGLNFWRDHSAFPHRPGFIPTRRKPMHLSLGTDSERAVSESFVKELRLKSSWSGWSRTSQRSFRVCAIDEIMRIIKNLDWWERA